AITSCVSTTTNRCWQNGCIRVGRHDHLWVEALAISVDERKNLALGNLDMLPAEQTRIDGPGTRSNHRQGDAQRCQHDGNSSPGTRISNPYLQDCDQGSADRSPQSKKQKYRCTGAN